MLEVRGTAVMEMVGLLKELGTTGGEKQQPDKEWEGEVQGNR